MPIPPPPLPPELEDLVDILDEATCLELVAEAFHAFDADAARALASGLGVSAEACAALLTRLQRPLS